MSGTIRRWSLRGIILGVLVFSILNTSEIQAFQADSGVEVTEAVSASSDAPSDASGTMAKGGLPWIAWVIPLLGVLGLVFTYWKSTWVARQEIGTEKMSRIADNISDGAMSVSYTHLTLPTKA